MKAIQRFATLLSLLAFCGAAAASNGSLNQFRPKVMPVLVQVNAAGKVTSAVPAMELSPRIARLLRTNLDEMISKPATDKHGHPTSSQFVINLALETTPRDNGQFDAHFAYVSTEAVPAGSWYWVHIDGHRLALASQDSQGRRQRLHNYHERYQPPYRYSRDRSNAPPASNAMHNASAPAPSPDPGQKP